MGSVSMHVPFSSPMSRTDINRLKGTVSLDFLFPPLAASYIYRKTVCSKKANFLRLSVVKMTPATVGHK
jgi:hypothetical protein